MTKNCSKNSSTLTVHPTFTLLQKIINLISHLCKKSSTMSMTIQWIVKLRTANCVFNLQRIFQWATARNSLLFSRCVHIDLMSSHIVKAIEREREKNGKKIEKMNNWIWQKISKNEISLRFLYSRVIFRWFLRLRDGNRFFFFFFFRW